MKKIADDLVVYDRNGAEINVDVVGRWCKNS